MIKEKIESKALQECYYKLIHKSGLTIFLYPKKNMSTTYAIYGTNYGSIDNHFTADGVDIKVADGIAHFLEHKLFENEDCDAFLRYAKYGASANAYTSFDMTCYLFSTTNYLEENLDILLDFVQKPYFTEQTVQKEQGIIGQEIRMYDDDPEWRVFFNLLGALYHNHPVRIDIAGTCESISHITAESLYTCYNNFYSPKNMTLCLCGDFDVDKIADFIDSKIELKDSPKLERLFESEPSSVNKDYVEQLMDVSIPLMRLGFKCDGEKRRSEKEQASLEILLEMLTSDYCALYETLIKEELINDSFRAEVLEGPNYSSIIFESESNDPEKLAKIMKDYIANLLQNGIDERDFERAKKTCYARNVANLNSTSFISNAIINLTFAYRELFSSIDEIKNCSFSDVKDALKNNFNLENCALSVVKPNK